MEPKLINTVGQIITDLKANNMIAIMKGQTNNLGLLITAEHWQELQKLLEGSLLLTDNEERAKTLKEIGELLEGKLGEKHHLAMDFANWVISLIPKLKQGKMPKE